MSLVLCCLLLVVAGRADEKLLLHWDFDGAGDGVAVDRSGNGLQGKMGAERVESPGGMAAMMDGTGKARVSVKMPEGRRFGRGSWTFMAMLKPRQFTIDARQNQRRVFSFGKYPDANLIIDINSTGRLQTYFCYKDDSGRIVATGGNSEVALAKDLWVHVAVVCDRDERRTAMYVNGFPAGSREIPAHFDGDFSAGGELSVGSGWQNYLGLADEVKVWRKALSADEVEAEFERLKPGFGVVESEELLEAKRRMRQEKLLGATGSAWAEGRFGEVRKLCGEVLGGVGAPDHFRSFAWLRIAQSWLAEKNHAAAKAEYRAIAGDATLPAAHRDEAGASVLEIDRLERGLPARDPVATRVALPAGETFAAEVFVAADGDDGGQGSSDQPFATLERARNAVRELRREGLAGAVAVTLKAGVHELRQSVALSAEDSGSESGPVVYRAAEKGTAIIYGGRRIRGFAPVNDPAVLRRLPAEARGKVWCCDLKALGITDYGEMAARGMGQPASPPTLELFVDGRPMTLARWPNEGFVGIRKLLKPGSREAGETSVFEYDSARHERWTGASDAWLFGYFHFLWADAAIKVGAIDPKTRTLSTARPYHYGGRGMSTVQGIQYYAFNLLEEIDRPGEWYLERETGLLYLYPEADPRKSVIEIGMLETPMITMENLSHVRLEGLVFDLARFNGIVAKGCENCAIVACTVGRMAGNGIMIHGGRSNRLIGCDIHTIGRRASEVLGGDRATLSPGGHLVENCRIFDFGRIDRTYTPAIQLEGVGNRVAHNLMYDGPSSAMRIEGNDHVIEFNEVHSMVRESDDQGALELFGNPSYRGVVFRHNHLHDIGKTGSEASVHGQAGIRFDDAISGMLVYGNVFHRCANGRFGAIQMNSGRDNLIDNNLFIDCKQGISGGWNRGNRVWTSLREGAPRRGIISNELYLKRYPKIATMLDEPAVNHVWRNLFYRCGTVATRSTNLDMFRNGVFEDRDPGFVDAGSSDFRLRQDAEAFRSVAFKPIPIGEIGLYESPARASWPVETKAVEMPDWRNADSAGRH